MSGHSPGSSDLARLCSQIGVGTNKCIAPSVLSLKFATEMGGEKRQILRSPPPNSTPKSKDRSLGAPELHPKEQKPLFGGPGAENPSGRRSLRMTVYLFSEPWAQGTRAIPQFTCPSGLVQGGILLRKVQPTVVASGYTDY
jgi:hypothetical protein